MRRAGGVLSAVAVLALLAGCGSNPRPTDSPSPSATGSGSSSPAPSTSAPPSGPPTATTTAPPTLEPTATTPAPAGDACASSSLTIAALPGSGSSGTQFEILQFTNSGSTACSLTGFPTVSLRLGGAALGDTATPSAAAASTVRLAPGDVATARLSGPSTCDAPLSDSVRVVAPGVTDYVDVPAVVRGCPLTVDPVTAS